MNVEKKGYHRLLKDTILKTFGVLTRQGAFGRHFQTKDLAK